VRLFHHGVHLGCSVTRDEHRAFKGSFFLEAIPLCTSQAEAGCQLLLYLGIIRQG
jgi:hypothetical protein